MELFISKFVKILQIGCHDGKDHVFEYVKQHKDTIEKIYLIDANLDCLEQSKQTYKDIPNVDFINCAIVVDDNVKCVDFFIPERCSSHASISTNYLSCHNDLKKQSVIAKTINKLFLELGITHLDRLYIDVESLDVDVVNSIDFSKFKIDFLMFECYHSDGRDSNGGPKLDAILKKISDIGYSYQKQELDIVAIKGN